jgi:hypothetical protein
MRSFWLKARSGIGIERLLAIQAKAIARTDGGGRETVKITSAFGVEHERASAGPLEHDLDRAPLRRPDAEVSSTILLDFRTDG